MMHKEAGLRMIASSLFMHDQLNGAARINPVCYMGSTAGNAASNPPPRSDQ